MARPKGFKATEQTRAAISAARTGKKWDASTRAKIGAGVRKGAENKVAFATRLDPEILRRFKSQAKKLKIKIAPALEQAMEGWVKT